MNEPLPKPKRNLKTLRSINSVSLSSNPNGSSRRKALRPGGGLFFVFSPGKKAILFMDSGKQRKN
jgi:hypothetical protein